VSHLTKRQEYILGLIVREYVSVPNPVGSKALVERYGLDVSSATVRNDMARLEEEGLIAAPHTSAGRVPTEEGYRYFVQKLLGDTQLRPEEQRTIRHQFHQVSADLEHWMRLAASILASTTRTASLVTTPQVVEPRFKHLELIHTQGRVVLLVMVLEGGAVRQQMLCLSEPVGQTQLSHIAAHINRAYAGKRPTEIRAQAGREATLDHEILDLVAELLDRAGRWQRTVITDGLVNILDPEYLVENLPFSEELDRGELRRALAEVDSIGARQTLHLLEERSLLEEILAEALAPDTVGVQVMIAGDGQWEELSHTSMVLARYGRPDVSGALGVLGPTRLHYGRAISTVRYIAGLMTDMLIEVYGDEEAG
jgi:heat-inducible transcriptional repressor